MVEVFVRLKSANGPQRDRPLGYAAIINDGIGTPTRGNYYALVKVGRRGKTRRVEIKDFPRRSRNAWELLRRVLNALKESK